MRKRERDELNEGEFFRFAKSYLSETFPNPNRIDCPPNPDVQRMAAHLNPEREDENHGSGVPADCRVGGRLHSLLLHDSISLPGILQSTVSRLILCGAYFLSRCNLSSQSLPAGFADIIVALVVVFGWPLGDSFASPHGAELK